MKKRFKRISATLMASALIAGICAGGFSTNASAMTENFNDAAGTTAWTEWKGNWENYATDYENVSLTPGADESQLNFAWYSKNDGECQIRFSDKKSTLGSAEVVKGNTQKAVAIKNGDADATQYYSNKVTIKGLKENTTYFYQVFKDGAWSDVETYTTKSFSSFSFLYVGDPQIGASKGRTQDNEGTTDKITEQSLSSLSNSTVTTNPASNLAARNDAYNWNKTLKSAIGAHPEVSFLASAGDQVNYAANETEYAGYLGAEALTGLPVATTIGNHDSVSYQYSLHYNNPNAFSFDDTTYTAGHTAAGSDYYYTYGNVLFIVLDTNNYNAATHKNVIDKAVKENPDAKWRVVMFHQDIYGSGYDHSDSDGIVLRTALTPIMDEYNIDVVLQGHDHTYSRTYQLQGDGKEHQTYIGKPDKVSAGDDNDSEQKTEYLAENNCYEIVNNTKSGTVTNPDGTVYLEANSATGSKFYNLIQTKQNYISERSQTWTPSYSVIDVTDNTFTVKTYDVATGAALGGSSEYTIVKKEAKDTVITGTAAYTKQVGDKAFTLAAKADSDGKMTYESSDEDVAIVSSTGKVSITGAGTAVIKVKVAEAEGKKAAEKDIVITVNEAPKALKAQTIKTAASYNKAYGAKAFKLNASAAGALSYSSSDAKVASVDKNGKVTIKGTGKATITIKAGATDTYKAASKKVTITVAPKAQSASVKATGKKQIKISWKKDSKATGYEINWSTGKKVISKNGTISYVVKGLKKSKTYTVKVRSFKKIAGKNIYGAYSTAKKVTVK